MPKLYSARILLSALQRAEFQIISQKGSHIKLFKRHGDKAFTVIVPNHKEIKLPTLKSVLKLAKIDEEDFAEYL